MDNEKPVRVQKYRSDGHRFERRIFARQIHETYCDEPKCRFYKQHAAQGVCHTRLRRIEQSYLDGKSKEAERLVSEMREIATRQKYSRAKYINYLERNIHCNWMNAQFTLDECIRLRAEVSVLRNQLERKRK